MCITFVSRGNCTFPQGKFTIQTGFAHAKLLTCFDCFWRFVHAKTMVFRSQTIILATMQTWTKLFISKNARTSKQIELLLFIVFFHCWQPLFLDCSSVSFVQNRCCLIECSFARCHKQKKTNETKVSRHPMTFFHSMVVVASTRL